MGKYGVFIILILSVFSVNSLANASWWDGFVSDAEISLGGGVIISKKPYGGWGTDTTIIPFANVYYQGLFFKGTKLGYEIYKDKQLTVSPIASWRFDGYESSDSSTLSGMSDRDMTIDAGLEIAYKLNFATFNASFVTDMLSEHDGYEIELGLSKRFGRAFGVEQLSIIPKIGVSFLSDNLVDYYYGVRASEATASRAAYSVDSSINYNAGFNLSYALDDKWDFITGFNYTWLDDEIHNSPIVSKSGVYSILIGATYEF